MKNNGKSCHVTTAAFMNSNEILLLFQSDFRGIDAPRTALLNVTNDLLFTIVSGDYDLGAAFDTVDDNTVLPCLEYWVGFKSTRLHWFSSYQTFSVCWLFFLILVQVSYQSLRSPSWNLFSSFCICFHLLLIFGDLNDLKAGPSLNFH